jgi:hypothetical protein
MPYLALNPALAEGAPAITFGAPETLTLHPNGKSLGVIRSRLILELGNRTDIPTEIWNDWINDAYLDIYASLALPESKRSFDFQLRANQMLYLLPPTVDTIRSIVVTDTANANNGVSLEPIDSATYRKFPVMCGAPEYWFREQNMIILWPTPDDDYPAVIDGIIKPAKLVVDSDYPILEDKFHEIVLKSAKVRAWEGVQNDTKSALVENSVARQVQRKNDRDQQDAVNEYPSMRPVRSRRDIMRLNIRGPRSEPGE